MIAILLLTVLSVVFAVEENVVKVSAESLATTYSWITLGDWGGAALDAGAAANVKAVASQMATTAKAVSSKFIINTGDNFYWCGIQNTTDFQIDVDFVQPYKDSSLQTTWYSTLGNHEYGYNVQAQIDYGKINNIWYLPSRYYTKRINLSGSNYLTMIVLDTSPCIQDYRNSNQKYWDPCSTTYPTCSLVSTDDDFEGPCQFHENILSQDCSAQATWLTSTLKTVSKEDWLVVVGHHPIDEVDVEDLTSIIQAHGFSIYLNGHSHALTHYSIDGKSNFVTSGAGSLVNTADQAHPVTSRKVRGENITLAERANVKHSYSTIFNQKVAGFTSHTFNSAFTQLTTNFVSNTGQVVHSFVVDKSGNLV
jgi:hypothetical protein